MRAQPNAFQQLRDAPAEDVFGYAAESALKRNQLRRGKPVVEAEMLGQKSDAGANFTSADRAAAAIVRGLVRRRSRVYVPRAVVAANWAKAALNSPAAWPWMRRFAAAVAPALEREVEALGRYDQLMPDAENPPASNLSANAAAIEPVAR